MAKNLFFTVILVLFLTQVTVRAYLFFSSPRSKKSEDNVDKQEVNKRIFVAPKKGYFYGLASDSMAVDLSAEYQQVSILYFFFNFSRFLFYLIVSIVAKGERERVTSYQVPALPAAPKGG